MHYCLIKWIYLDDSFINYLYMYFTFFFTFPVATYISRLSQLALPTFHFENCLRCWVWIDQQLQRLCTAYLMQTTLFPF